MFILRPDASVFLFTPCWDEPFGLPAIEAMCTGLPVGAVAMGAVHEVVGKACTYASPDDAAGLAQALLAAMDIRPKIPARRIRAHFSLDRMLDRYVALYEAARTGESAASPRAAAHFRRSNSSGPVMPSERPSGPSHHIMNQQP